MPDTGQLLNTECIIEPTMSSEGIRYIVLSSQEEFVDNVVIQEPLGSSDHNQLLFNIKIKSDKTKVKQCRMDFRKGNYNEIRKSLAHVDGKDKMKNKTATECWTILRSDLVLLIDMCLRKSKGNVLRRNICQKRPSERLDINKRCGEFVNIRERIKILRLTRRH